MKAIKSVVAAAFLALAMPSISSAAVDVFLKLDGIKGESKDDKHKDEIVIESWSFGAKAETAAATGPGLRTGKACLSEISLVKLVDKASPLLLQAAMMGQHIKEATLSVRKAGDKQEFLIVKFKEVFVTSVQQSGGGDGVAEAIALDFGTVEMTYTSDDPKAGQSVKTTINDCGLGKV